MKSYYRVMLGKKSSYAAECFSQGFIGADFDIDQDLTHELPEEWREFNKKFISIYLSIHPEKTKIGAGLACGMLWTISKGIAVGDIILAPDGEGRYRVGEVISEYFYKPEVILPHRRSVRWLDAAIDRTNLSIELKNSAGSIGTVCNISNYGDEIERLIAGSHTSPIVSTDETILDPSAFAMEKHLEDFLVQNWSQTELARDFIIYEEDGECVGQQYQTDTGPLDILAISKDKKTLLVIELKKGRASDVVVGQTLRYMGYVQEELAEPHQSVRGIIIALEDDPKIRRALMAVPSISFYRYQITFKLQKV